MTRAAAPASGAPPLAASAERAMLILAVDPHGLGGVWVRGREPEVRAWFDTLRDLLDALPDAPPIARLPISATLDAVSGGLDVAASLASRASRVSPGLLSRSDRGVVVAPGAERLAGPVVSEICSALDQGTIHIARDGLDMRLPARIALVALDSGEEAGEQVAPALAERLALWIQADPAPPTCAAGAANRVIRARAVLPGVRIDAEALRALCATADAVGEVSLRAVRFGVRVACVLAALDGRRRVSAEHLTEAAALVLAPRAKRLPVSGQEQAPAAPEPSKDAERRPETSAQSEAARKPQPADLQEMTIAAVRACAPAGVFDAVGAPSNGREGGRRTAGRSRKEGAHGASAGVRRCKRGDRRFALAETLKAAAPWQSIRHAAPVPDSDARPGPAIRVAASDLRRRVRRPRPRTAVTLVVDASGSSAAQRLAEAKGAVEALLDRCYARRDEVALLTFRGTGAELALPPTRSLTRVRRRLGDLTAGGGTPLASGLEAGARTALVTRDRGAQALLVVLTDGRANIARDGAQGRAVAHADALQAARDVRAQGLDGVLIDISPRGESQAREVADAMGARYLRLPHVEAGALAKAVRGAGAGR